MKEAANRHRRQPEFGKLIKMLNDKFNILIFTESFYIVGEGTYGKCYIGKICDQRGEQLKDEQFMEVINDEKVVVVKIIRKRKQLHQNSQLFKKQMYNLGSLHTKKDNDCTNIVKVFPQLIQSPSNYYIIMQYCHHSNLSELIRTRKQKKGFSLFQFIQILLDLTNGYLTLKKNHIMHNDIKPQNIFIKDKIFKLGDFGLSTSIARDEQYKGVGTESYTSPERFNQTDVNHKSDIFAIGIIMYELMFDCHPYYQESDRINIQELFNYERRNVKLPPRLNLNTNEEEDLREMQIRNEKQKQIRRGVFSLYLSTIPTKTLESVGKVTLKYDKKYEQCVEELKKIVIGMCQLNYKNRLSIQSIANKLVELKLKEMVDRNDLFPDLKELRSSQLQFQVGSFVTKQGFSNVLRKQLKLQEKECVPTFVEGLKNRLTSTAIFLKIIDEVVSEKERLSKKLKTTCFQSILNIQINTYCFYLNNRHYSNIKKTLKDELISNNDRQTLDKLLIVNRQDDEYIRNHMLHIVDNGSLQNSREKVRKQLKDVLMYLNIARQNWEEVYLLLIVYQIINCEEKYYDLNNDQQIFGKQDQLRRLLQVFGQQSRLDKIIAIICEFEDQFNFTFSLGISE